MVVIRTRVIKIKIIIFGGAGYVGASLVPALLQRDSGVEVTVFDNLMYNQVQFMEYFKNPQFKFINGDVRNYHEVKKAVEGQDMIIHLAAIVGAPACNRDVETAKDINLQGTININDAREKKQKVIFASTGSVYGKVDGICTEESPTNPLSVYGQTKLDAEKVLLKKGNVVIYRFATGFGLSPRMRFDLFINDFVYKAINDKYLVVYDKDFKRTFIHISDMVRSYDFAIVNFSEMKNQIYNVGSPDLNFTKEQIVKRLYKMIDFQALYVDKGTPDPDQRDYAVSYDKINKLGFKTMMTLDAGIMELVMGMQMIKRINMYSNV